MNFISLLILIGVVVTIFILIKEEEKLRKDLSNNKYINDISYQKYAKFYGEMAIADPLFDKKVKKIYDLLEKEKCDDLNFIAKESNCTLQECILKIKYLKNKKILGDYYIDNLSGIIKKCEGKDKELLAKYSKFINSKHMQIEEIASKMPNATSGNLKMMKERVIKEIEYLIDKNLLTGITLNKVDEKIVYYDLEERRKGKNRISIDCPHCGALNEVNRGSKVRCEYCEAIIEAPMK